MDSTRIHSAQHLKLYQATVEGAAAGGGVLIGRLIDAAARELYTRELTARSMTERDALLASSALLHGKRTELCVLYPKLLLQAFTSTEPTKKLPSMADAVVHFDQLELMDEAQVHASVVVARVQQSAMLAADSSLAELNTVICGALGLKTVRPESNPLNPNAYVTALHTAIEQIGVSSAVRMEWLACMSAALGTELRELYRGFSVTLRSQGVASAGYAIAPMAAGAVANTDGGALQDSYGQQSWPNSRDAAFSGAARPSGSGRVNDEALLTLDTLRRLLSGELARTVPLSRADAFAEQFAREFDGEPSQGQMPISGFDATVPAAFEALAEMKQVDQVVQSLQQRRKSGTSIDNSQESSVEAIRDSLRRTATGVAQALSLEVVTLMVDNMVRNPRLLKPIQQLVADLEPSLLLLSLADPRFFSDKAHPARQLLEEITHRSQAYESTQADGFQSFFIQLQNAVEPLATEVIEDAEPFERVLSELREVWRFSEQHQERARDEAVQALQHAEQRNILAEKIARDIDGHPDSAMVPEVVIVFLCGPWAQVVAQARISGGSGSSAADKYQALISAMLWSTHPDLNRSNFTKLTRLVPLLLSTLREGLETIHYPSTRTSAFLEALMGLHQQAFSAAKKAADAPTPPAAVPQAKPEVRLAAIRRMLVEDGDPWVAPEEAAKSNFMELPDLPDLPQDVPSPVVVNLLEPEPVRSSVDALPLGSWVELLVSDNWVRTQLTWASPHGTLFLFTSAFGTTQSMTRRSRDKLVAAGSLRLFSGPTVVDGALDAVAQIAMRNSMDVTL